MEKLKQIREKESNDYDHAVKVQQKLAANAVWTDVGDDFEKNFIQPLKKYSGLIFEAQYCKFFYDNSLYIVFRNNVASRMLSTKSAHRF